MSEPQIFRLRTGCQWHHLPRVYGDESTIQRCFQHGCETGLSEKLWALWVAECADLQGVNWEWQAADTAMGKARFGGAMSDPTPPTGARMGANTAS